LFILDNTEKIITEKLQAVQAESLKNHGQIFEALKYTQEQSKLLRGETQKINSMLGGNQSRGKFGENVIEEFFRAVGFKEGVHFERQYTTEEGGRPDFVFHLPEGKFLPMDSKFPFADYYRYWNSDDEEVRKREYRNFEKSIEKHIKELAKRDYHGSEQMVDFTIMMIPNDGLYSYIEANSPYLFYYALERKVIVCSPLLLFPLLSIVKESLRSFYLQEASNEVLQVLENFQNQWSKFSEEFNDVGKSISKSMEHFDKIGSTRKKQMERVLKKIDEISLR
jgi:DNA recombination protein RmuC